MSRTNYEPIPDPPTTLSSPDDDALTALPVPSPRGKWLVITGLCLCSIGVLTDGSVITVGIPSISSDIELMKHLGWSTTAFLLMACVGQLPFARLYGLGLNKNLLICGVLFYHLGTTLCGVASSLPVFVLGRAISGVGAASLYIGTNAVLVSLVTANDIALCLSIFSFVSFLHGVVLPVICGLVIDHYSWRPIFFLSLPLSLLGFSFLFFAYAIDTVDQGQVVSWRVFNMVDFAGTALLLMAFACLLAPVGPRYGLWASARLLGFGALIFAFGSLQHVYASLSTFTSKVFMKRYVWLSSIVVCLLEMAIFTHLFYLALFYQAVKNFTAQATGLQETIYMAAMASASLASGTLVRHCGRPVLWLGIGIAISAIAASLLVGLTPHTSLRSWLPFTLSSALGAGACLQLPFVIVTSQLQGNEKITGNSIIVFSHSLGGPVGTSLAHLTFSAEMLRGLQNEVPELDAGAILSMGIPQLRTTLPEHLLPAVLSVYCQAINRVLLIPAIALMGATVGVFLMIPGWNILPSAKTSSQK